MQIVISDSVNSSDKLIINNAVKAVFDTKGIDINAFSPSRTLFISNSETDKADYIFNIPNFLGENIAFKLIVLKNLANAIFSEYVDPRIIIDKYNNIAKQNPPIIKDYIAPTENTLKKAEPTNDVVEAPIKASVDFKNSTNFSGKNWFKK